MPESKAVHGGRGGAAPKRTSIPTFYRQVSEGKPCTVVEDATRDFVFIEDLVKRVISDPRPGTFDIRTGTETSISLIPLIIGEILDIEPIVNLVPRREDDVAFYDMSGDPSPGTSFLEGMLTTVAWYERHPVTDTYTHLRLGAENAD